MMRIFRLISTPLLLLLLLLSVLAKHDQAELRALQKDTYLEAAIVRSVLSSPPERNHFELEAMQRTYREVMAIRAQLDALTDRMANMDSTASTQPGQDTRRTQTEAEPSLLDLADPKMLDENIRSTGARSREITRSLVDSLLSNPTPIMRQMRIVPSKKNGKANGAKLFAIRPDSVYARLGFINGDILHSVNGREFNPGSCSPISDLQNGSSSWSFEITRGGKEEAIVISIGEWGEG